MPERLHPASRRLLHLDVLRGFALLGILLVNFEWFARPIQAIVLGAEPDLAGVGLITSWLIKALAEGKFYALFSMLFGAGFALMAERASERLVPFWGVYLRRLFLLLLFGIGHMLLVWAGDILVVYSVCAFIMVLLYRKTPAGRLWKWAIAWFLLPLLIFWLGALSIVASQFDADLHAGLMAGFQSSEAEIRMQVEQAQRIQATGSWRENVGQRIRDGLFLASSAPFWVPPILAYFLLGRWLLVSGRLARPDDYHPFFKRWRWLGLLVGLPLSIAGTAMLFGSAQIIPTPDLALGTSLFLAGSLLLSMGYLSTIVLAARRLAILAPAGQMALTNYLTQSLFWTWALYGHGLGLGEFVPRGSFLLLALAFFALQLAFSHWWMARYRFGPAEWLWRSLTYMQRQPMRRQSS